MLCPFALLSEGRLKISVSGSFFMPGEDDFKNLYGDSFLLPEFKVSFTLISDLYLWGSYGFFSGEGKTAVLEMPMESSQSILAFGAGYSVNFALGLSGFAEAGAAVAGYREEGMDQKVEGSPLGFIIQGGLNYKIGKMFFMCVTLGYYTATDTQTILEQAVDVKLGGVKAGFGIGLAVF